MAGASKKYCKICWIEQGDAYILSARKAHNSSYRSTIGGVDDLNVPAAVHPFIQSGILAAEASFQDLSDVKLHSFVKEYLIEMNSETMELCGMNIGNPIIASKAFDPCSSFSVYRAWPSRRIGLGKVGFTRRQLQLLDLEPGSFVFVATPCHKVTTASQVKISPLLEAKDFVSFLSTSHFEEYLSMNLEKMYLGQDHRFTFIYFGKPFTFVVKEVQGVEAKASVPCSCDVENRIQSELDEIKNLTSNLESSLNLSHCELEQSLRSDATSTPIKSNENCAVSPPKLCGEVDDNLRLFVAKRKTYRVYSFSSQTSLQFLVKPQESQVACRESGFELIGGLEQQKQVLRDTVVLPLRKPEIFADSGGQPVHGIILHGPSGTGKSLLAKAVASEAGACCVTIRGDDIISRYLGESEKQLREVFDEAKAKAPCVLVIDEIDTFCPRRDSSQTDAARRMVTCLGTILDDFSSSNSYCALVVLATTNRLESIDPALRRPGRFDLEIEISIPSEPDRREILQIQLSDSHHNLTKPQLEKLSDEAHGYVGADLAAVCTKARLRAVMRHSKQGKTGDKVRITAEDIEHGLTQTPPSAMRELIVQVPTVRWSDIGGNEAVKKKLKQAVEWPLKRASALKRLGVNPPRGVLLYGPPGCSKTLTAKALATESGLNFISIKGPELFSKYVGDSERAVRRLFSKARAAAPSIVFIDELDALAVERGSGNLVADRVLTAMLTEMDGVEKRDNVIVVAATNRPDMIDKALLRPGRIDKMLYVPLPDANTRRAIFEICFSKTPVDGDVDLEDLIEKTEMYSGAEICSVVTEAALAALEDDPEASFVSRKHFDRAVVAVVPQTTKEKAKAYEEYGETLQGRIR